MNMAVPREACVTVSREMFEYEMVPWIGREYAAWLRTSARPHSADEHRLVLLPERIYQVFASRSDKRATHAELEAMGYPRLPEEHELQEAHQEQQAAAAVSDTRKVAELHQRIENLERQLEAARSALERWRRADPEQLEEQVAWELAHAPNADVLVGVA
jgi:hypothetical protein